jgi:hypothetical protein
MVGLTVEETAEFVELRDLRSEQRRRGLALDHRGGQRFLSCSTNMSLPESKLCQRRRSCEGIRPLTSAQRLRGNR